MNILYTGGHYETLYSYQFGQDSNIMEVNKWIIGLEDERAKK